MVRFDSVRLHCLDKVILDGNDTSLSIYSRGCGEQIARRQHNTGWTVVQGQRREIV